MKTPAPRRPRKALCLGVVLAGLTLSAPALAEGFPPLHPNSEHYRDGGASAVTGRSGSAEVQVRALTGRNRTTDVELTTGSFAPGAEAPGRLSEVQLKTFDASGALRSTRTFHRLANVGAADLQFTDLARGEPLQVQANVAGIDGARTDVVTVQTTVKLRPDLSVDRVTLPSSTVVQSAVNLSALISERNGDVGANADCVLAVDGVEVDRAVGIWVDAGRSVSCAFVHTFTELGPHTVAVTAADVSPMDDDPSNNAGSASITVIPPAAFRYSASIRSYAYENVSTTSSSYWADDGSTTSGSDFGTTTRSVGHSQQANFVGQLDVALDFPLRVAVTESSDGAIVGQVKASLAAGSSQVVNGAVRTCGSHFDSATYRFLFACSTASESAPLTSLSYNRFAGDVTYFSSKFSDTWWRDDATGQTTPTDSWTTNSESSSTQGSELPVGATYRFAVELGGAEGAPSSASAEIRTAPFELTTTQPLTCYQYATGSSLSRSCWGWSQSETGVTGQARSGL